MALLLALALAASIDVPAGAPLAPALARLRPGDVLRLGPGLHRGSLGRLGGVAVEGAGAGVTVVEAAPGEVGVTASGDLALSGLTLSAGEARCALRVSEGEVLVRGAALVGGTCGAFVDGGRLRAEEVTLVGGQYALLASGGDVEVTRAALRGGVAGAALLRGTLRLSRAAVTGPSREAAVSVAGGEAWLDDVVIADPGPSGISVLRGALTARNLTVAGPREESGVRGDCVQAIRGEVRLADATLVRCGGMAAEVSGGVLRLDGVDVQGGSAGGIALTAGARADLQGVVATGRGPALVVEGASSAQLRMNTWLADPALWVDCAGGARARVLYGEALREPCSPPRAAGASPQPRSSSRRRRRSGARSGSLPRSVRSWMARR